MKKYYFEYYGWIPGYNDFDQDDVTITAASEPEAWKQFNKLVKYAKSAALVSIDGVKLEKPITA